LKALSISFYWNLNWNQLIAFNLRQYKILVSTLFASIRVWYIRVDDSPYILCLFIRQELLIAIVVPCEECTDHLSRVQVLNLVLFVINSYSVHFADLFILTFRRDQPCLILIFA